MHEVRRASLCNEFIEVHAVSRLDIDIAFGAMGAYLKVAEKETMMIKATFNADYSAKA